MFYIIYVSTATKPMSDQELGEILEVSRRNNVPSGLTGVLIYRYSPDEKMGCFIQLLEGEKEKVLETYRRIAEDNRHHSKIVIEEGTTDARQFPSWSMGFKNIDLAAVQDLPGFANLGKPDFDAQFFKNSSQSARETLGFFYDAD